MSPISLTAATTIRQVWCAGPSVLPVSQSTLPEECISLRSRPSRVDSPQTLMPQRQSHICPFPRYSVATVTPYSRGARSEHPPTTSLPLNVKLSLSGLERSGEPTVARETRVDLTRRKGGMEANTLVGADEANCQPIWSRDSEKVRPLLVSKADINRKGNRHGISQTSVHGQRVRA